MSHALIWSEINQDDLNSESKKEIQVAGLGTNVSGTWTKKIFKLKWINSSVSDIKLWLDSSYAEIYENNSNFPTYNPKNLFDLNNDINFDFRILRLNNNNITYLPEATAAAKLYENIVFASSDIHVNLKNYVDGHKIGLDSKILLLNQDTNAGLGTENGLYKIVGDIVDTDIAYRTHTLYNILTAGRNVSVGNSSYMHWFQNLIPGETFDWEFSPSTIVNWVSRNNLYQLDDVDVATVGTLTTTASGLALSTRILDNYTLSLSDRVLVKDQLNPKLNGIYYISKLYSDDKNTIINPNTSTDSLDDYWDEVIFNIYQDRPVSVRVGHGITYGGSYFRFYKSSYSEVTSFLVRDTQGDDNTTASLGSTLNYQWVDATRQHKRTFDSDGPSALKHADWYYAVGATEGSFSSNSLYNMPTYITDYTGAAILTTAGSYVLVNHSIKPYSGVYNIDSVGLGNTSVWTRVTLMNQASEIVPWIIKVLNNRTSIGSSASPYWYLGREASYKLSSGGGGNIPNPSGTNQWILNADNILVSERFIPWRYQDVTNLITSEILDFNRVNTKQFNKSGVGLTERTLVIGQGTTESQNGIYVTEQASSGSTYGLSFHNTYYIKNGTLFQDLDGSASGKTYFLYSSQENVSAGSTTVKFVNFSEPTWISVDAQTTVDKFTSGRYITPDDFNVDINNNDVIFVNTLNDKVNGVYDATLGSAEKAVFDYSDNYVEWLAEIYRNILNEKEGTKFNLSTNLKKQTKGILLSRNSGGYGDTNYSSSKLGNIYVPEIVFANSLESEKYFSEEYKGSALTQEIDIDWYEQDYQKFVVSAVYKTNTLSGFPLSSGTAISSNLSDGSLVSDHSDILVYVGNGISSESSYNGIYKANLINNSLSVYFTKHEDFDKSTEYESNSNIKVNGTPYERPTKVSILNGYFTSGSSFGYSTVYMQGVLSNDPYNANLGSTSVTPGDDNQYNAGTDIYIRNSSIRLSVDYNNLFHFAKLSPFNHFIVGDLKNRDTVDNDILIVNRGYQLYTLASNSFTKYYYEIGDRVIYQDETEEDLETNEYPTINGIYVISHIDRDTWSYYLRKVKQNASIGHLDYAKKLVIHPDYTLFDNAFNVTSYGGAGNTYYWTRNNYDYSEAFIIQSDGTVNKFIEGLDYGLQPEIGWLFSATSWSIDGDFYCYLYQNSSIPKHNEVPKSLKNRYHSIEQVITDKYAIRSGNALSSTNYNIDKTYIQLSYNSGNATTTNSKNNSDRIHWYFENDNSKNYFVNLKNIAEIGNTSSYFVTSRQTIDGYFNSYESVYSSNFYDTNLVDPGTGISQALYAGSFYVDKINTAGTAISTEDWFSVFSLSTNDNILILNNNNSSIAETFQTYYYNDNNKLTKHYKSGKRDQKLIKYKDLGFTPVTLTYNTAFGVTFLPTAVSSGSNNYLLHYDPDANQRSIDSRKWYDLDGLDKYEYDYETSYDVTDLNDLQGVINGTEPAIGNTILVKAQSSSRFNGLYSVIENELFKLNRSFDLYHKSQIQPLARVQYGIDEYELIVPDSVNPFNSALYNYTIGSTSGNTPLVWNKVGYGQTIDVEVTTFANFASTTLNGNFPDTIDGKLLFENNKILLLNQTDSTQKYVGRFTKNYSPELTRVVAAGATNTAGFAITSCYVLDTNRNKEYEIYFSGERTAVGSTAIYWFEKGSIEDYESVDYEFNGLVDSSGSGLSIPLGSKLIKKAQADYSDDNNALYVYDYEITYRMIRDDSLDKTSQITPDKRVRVLNGKTFPGIYALVYDEDSPFTLNTNDLNFFKVPENYNFDECKVATTEEIDLNSPPAKIDDINLKVHDRVLVKNQSDQTKNGIYVVKDLSNSIWARSEDLNSSDKIYPQTTIKIETGNTNGGKIFRIKLPFGNVGYDYQFYVLDADNIQWVPVDGTAKYYESPENWQILGTGTTNAFYLGTSKMDLYGISESDRFAIAFKSPSASKFSGNGITQSGRIRNLKFKVEYNTIED